MIASHTTRQTMDLDDFHEQVEDSLSTVVVTCPDACDEPRKAIYEGMKHNSVAYQPLKSF
jgi:hypothetical protein